MKPYQFRKLLHMIACLITVVMLMKSSSWKDTVLSALIAIVLVYPLLSLLENKKSYARFFVEKEPGEVKLSLILLFGMLIVLTLIGWGIFDKKYAVLASLLMWGFGDASAALIGIPFGKHKVFHKSLEGSLAMFLVSFAMCFIVIKLHGIHSITTNLLYSVVCALVCTLSELFSPGEYDTFIVPVVTLVSLLVGKVF